MNVLIVVTQREWDRGGDLGVIDFQVPVYEDVAGTRRGSKRCAELPGNESDLGGSSRRGVIRLAGPG